MKPTLRMWQSRLRIKTIIFRGSVLHQILKWVYQFLKSIFHFYFIAPFGAYGVGAFEVFGKLMVTLGIGVILSLPSMVVWDNMTASDQAILKAAQKSECVGQSLKQLANSQTQPLINKQIKKTVDNCAELEGIPELESQKAILKNF